MLFTTLCKKKPFINLMFLLFLCSDYKREGLKGRAVCGDYEQR